MTKEVNSVKFLEKLQQNEITEHYIYRNLSKKAVGKNKLILKKISDDELKHYHFWKKHTQKKIKPDKIKLFIYLLLSKIFGLIFAIKLMENGEENAQKIYKKLVSRFKDVKNIIHDEHEHEKELIDLLHESKLDYIGSIVLGLNDALVELTGALAGFTLAFEKTMFIATAGLITGISASMSMMASEYLSRKADERGNAFKASIYTGLAYITTVILLVLPFFIFKNQFVSLALTFLIGIFVIGFFTFFVSVVKEVSFKKRFFEMATISLSVAVISFAIGFLIKNIFGIQI